MGTDENPEHHRTRREALRWGGIGTGLLLVLLLVPRFTLFPEHQKSLMLLTHLMLELFAVGVSLLVVVIGWHNLNREQMRSANLIVMGFCVIAGLDLAHSLAYDGMPNLLGQPSTPLSIYFWLAGRVATGTLLAAIALDLRMPVSRGVAFLASIVVLGLLGWVGLQHLDWFPTLFRTGVGVTAFKGQVELAVSALQLVAAAIIWRQARRRAQPWLHLVAAAAFVMSLAGPLFTTYRSTSDFANIVGHVFKIAGYALIYRGIYLTALRAPYERLERSERALRQAESELRAMIDSVPFQAWVRDSQNRIVIENSAMVGRWGSLLGTRLEDSDVSQDTLAPRLEGTRRAFAGEVFSTEIGYRIDGELRTFQNIYAPVRNQGRITGTVGVSIDITESKRALQEIERLNAQLEERVRDRTRELLRVNAELEEFSASVSHDLQAPLRNIAGYAALLKEMETSLDPDARELVQGIERQTQRASGLIKDLLNLARIGRMDIKRIPVDLDRLVAEVIDSVAELTLGRHVAWRIDALPTLEADEGLLRQAFVNLINNALKFSVGKDPALIRIAVATDRGEPGETVILVQDNGVGFDMGKARKLFGAFQRLHAESEFKGTGIGLANVRRIVERHGGRIWAESSPGAGATFYMAFPAPAEKGG